MIVKEKSVKAKDVEDFFRRLQRVYQERCSEIMKENPDSYTTTCFDESSKEPLLRMKFKRIKPEYEPEFTDRLKNNILNTFSKEDILFNYEYVFTALSADFKIKVAQFLAEIYNDNFLHTFEAITLSGFRWTTDKALSKEDAYLIYQSIHNELTTPFNDKRFTAELTYSSSFYGMTENKANLKRHTFIDRHFDKEKNEYVTTESKRVFLDSKLALLFCFKGKPAFYVGFHIDENLNVFVRQIQGAYKGRGHYVLGDKWQKTVIDYLKNTLSFVNKIHVITEDSVYFYLTKLYGDEYVKEVHDPIFKKASESYTMFKSDTVLSIKDVHAGGFKQSFKIKDKYYQIN